MGKQVMHSCHLPVRLYPGSRGPNAERDWDWERQHKEKPEAKRRASGLWESHFHVGIWFRFWTLSLIGFLNSYSGTTVDIWYNNDSYWFSICRHGSEVDTMEVRFSTDSLRLWFFLLLSLSLCIRASGTRVVLSRKWCMLGNQDHASRVNSASWVEIRCCCCFALQF